MAFIRMTGEYIPPEPKIYGAEWDGSSSPAWTRTDDAVGLAEPVPAVNNGNGSSPFDEIMPWAGMKRIEDADAGTLVEIPKFWYKWTQNNATMKLQISSTEVDGFFVSPAHADRGDNKGERDLVYVGAYHCATSTYKSTTGVKPANNMTRANFRYYIHQKGSAIWQWDFAIYWTIMMLYLVEYANWNSQIMIGYGNGNGSTLDNSGLCDSMIYHTGTNVVNRTTYGHTRYRYIEDLWGNVFDWIDGIYFSNYDVYCIKNPSNFADSGNAGTYIGLRTIHEGYTSSWTNFSTNGFEYVLLPNETNGSDSTYICDYHNCNSYNGIMLTVGGVYYGANNTVGAFNLNSNYTASSANEMIGSRLMKLP